MNVPVEIDLEAMLDTVVAMFAEQITARNVEIKINQGMPMVEGDSGRVYEVFQNLIENALKFVGEQAPLIEIGARETDGRVLCHVRDNGVGIEPEFLEGIFEFVRKAGSQD
ncbi:MAG: hypothetical protein GY935_26420 [Gammaproteobacteria bacterium]|nr:hypothetical protein [Gammaproteobacteria bacterium]